MIGLNALNVAITSRIISTGGGGKMALSLQEFKDLDNEALALYDEEYDGADIDPVYDRMAEK
jgi:hypothetical protein